MKADSAGCSGGKSPPPNYENFSLSKISKRLLLDVWKMSHAGSGFLLYFFSFGFSGKPPRSPKAIPIPISHFSYDPANWIRHERSRVTVTVNAFLYFISFFVFILYMAAIFYIYIFPLMPRKTNLLSLL